MPPQPEILRSTDGPPASGPRPRPAVRMSWTNLLFLHWPVSIEAVQRHLPPGVEVDIHNGQTWVGLVPFTMTDCHFAGFGLVPGLRDFHECNVRVYVRVGGRAGVWFLSLDAANLFPVLGGRMMWQLNYVYSRFNVTERDGIRTYALTRRLGPWPRASTEIHWTTGAPRPKSEPGSLEHFLTERYWLFTRRRGTLFAGRIHHDAWPLVHADVRHLDDTLVHAAGFGTVTDAPPLAMAAHRIDVLGDPLTQLDQASSSDAAP